MCALCFTSAFGQRADTHSSTTAEQHYLKLSCRAVAEDSSKVHARLLGHGVETGSCTVPLPPPGVPTPARGAAPQPSFPFCGNCGAAGTGTPFCAQCGMPAASAPATPVGLMGSAPAPISTPPSKRSAPAPPSTPPSERGAPAPPSTPPSKLLNPRKQGTGSPVKAHVKIPWLKEEIIFVKEWVEAHPPTPGPSGRSVMKWAACAADGKGVLQPGHQGGTFVRSCYRTFLRGTYSELLP
jgi:hypothetical protein